MEKEIDVLVSTDEQTLWIYDGGLHKCLIRITGLKHIDALFPSRHLGLLLRHKDGMIDIAIQKKKNKTDKV